MVRTHSTTGTVLMAALMVGAVLIAASPARGTPVTISDTRPAADYNQQITSEDGSGPLITATPFDFSGSAPLKSVSRVSLTFSMWDGDTDQDNIDYNDLYVTLDGAEPSSQRLYVNGFPDQRQGDPTHPDDMVTWENDFTWDVSGDDAFTSTLLDRVGAGGDGLVNVRLWDEDPTGNRVGLSSDDDATLELTGKAMPEPSTIALFLLGLAGVAAVYRTRRGRSG